MSTDNSDNKRLPICPETPPRVHDQAPHRELPPRPPKPPEPAHWKHPPRLDFVPLDKRDPWKPIQDIIDRYRAERKAALDTIKRFKSKSKAYDVEAVRNARRFLDNWRAAMKTDLDARIPGFTSRPGKTPPRKTTR